MNQDAKSLIEEVRKRVIEGCDKERYLFEPEYHAWITQCANAAEMGVRLAIDALEASEVEKVQLKNGIALEQEGLVKALEGQESLRKEVAEREESRWAVEGHIVELRDKNKVLQAQLQQTQARLEEATRNAIEQGKHLEIIAKDLRASGDVPLIYLDEEGVTKTAVTLADEIGLISFILASLQDDKEVMDDG